MKKGGKAFDLSILVRGKVSCWSMLLDSLRCKARLNGDSSQAPSGSVAKKQRSIHDFFSQSSVSNKRQGGKLHKARRSLEASAKGKSFSSAVVEEGEDEVISIQKRINYDVMDDESSEEPAFFASQTSDSGTRSKPRPKKIDFTGCSSQRSEPDYEPAHTTPIRFGLPFTGQGCYTPRRATPLQQYSQDSMDFLTPRDQPVIPLSNPTTPSPLKKRPRISEEVDVIQEEQVQNLTQDMTHMEMRHAQKDLPSFSSQSSMDMSSPNVDVAVNATRANNEDQASSYLSENSYVNPFAPEPTTESGRKKISRRKRRSFPSAWNRAKNNLPVSRYLADFSELGLIGSGTFSHVYKCMKKIDGWIYAVKKSKRHFRGKADTERALREVQALAAMSSSNHVVRYFDAWIEDDLLYIQLENLEGCSLAGFVNKYAPHKVPEEMLCKLLCHIAQALYDMHSKKMVHMDVKLQNVLVGSG